MSRRLLAGIAVEIHEPTGKQGDLTPVLMLHGIGGSADSMAGLGGLLAASGRRAIAWDAPGYGRSEDPGPDLTGADSSGTYADLASGLLARLDLQRVHLLGVSWGGVIATYLTARRPDLVASLTLVDSTRGSGTSPEKATGMRDRVTELVEIGPRAFAARRAPRLLAAGTAAPIADEVRRQMSEVRVAGYSGAAHMMAISDTGPLLTDIQVPTLVVVGEEDRVTGVPESRLLSTEIPDARLVVVPHAGHAAAQERPDAVADAVRAFLDDHEPAEARR